MARSYAFSDPAAMRIHYDKYPAQTLNHTVGTHKSGNHTADGFGMKVGSCGRIDVAIYRGIGRDSGFDEVENAANSTGGTDVGKHGPADDETHCGPGCGAHYYGNCHKTHVVEIRDLNGGPVHVQ